MIDALLQRPAAIAPQATSIREVSAARTLDTIRPLLPHFGIHRIVDVSLEGVSACPVFQVVRDDARSEYFNAGKGYTGTESLVSGLMEAIEVHCYERADPALLLRRQDIVAADGATVIAARLLQAAAPAGIAVAADAQEPFVRGHCHVHGRTVYLPAGHAYRDLGDGVPTGASPNGVASGNSANEALAHALCEMLERHALAHFNDGAPLLTEWVTPPGDSAHLQACIAQLQARGISAELLLISTLAGVSVFICFLGLHDAQGNGLAVQGYGAHLDPTIAMARALAEAVQILALCPAHEVGGAADGAGAETVVMTSKQSALLDPALIARQRRADHRLLSRLRRIGPACDIAYLRDDAGEDLPVTADGVLGQVVDGLRREGVEHLYSCVISPPALPVVVVKCFCPALRCIEGL